MNSQFKNHFGCLCQSEEPQEMCKEKTVKPPPNIFALNVFFNSFFQVVRFVEKCFLTFFGGVKSVKMSKELLVF